MHNQKTYYVNDVNVLIDSLCRLRAIIFFTALMLFLHFFFVVLCARFHNKYIIYYCKLCMFNVRLSNY